MQLEDGIYVVLVLMNDAIALDVVVDSDAADADASIPADVVMTLVRTGTLRKRICIGVIAAIRVRNCLSSVKYHETGGRSLDLIDRKNTIPTPGPTDFMERLTKSRYPKKQSQSDSKLKFGDYQSGGQRLDRSCSCRSTCFCILLHVENVSAKCTELLLEIRL